MAYSKEEWAKVRGFFECGLTPGEITKREDVEIKDRALIHRRAQKEGWAKGEKTALLEKEVKARQDVAEIKQQKQQLKNSGQDGAVFAIDQLVRERTQDIQTYHGGSRYLAKRALAKIQNKSDEDLTMTELVQAQAVLSKGQETIYGKSPEVVINNSAQAGAISANIDLDALDKARAKILDDV